MKQHRDRYDNQDDATLVASILEGEREAFDILLSRYSSSGAAHWTALFGNTFEAQDIAQEASLQAFLGLARLQEPARFAAWFHAIAANLARSALRRRRERSLLRKDDPVLTFATLTSHIAINNIPSDKFHISIQWIAKTASATCVDCNDITCLQRYIVGF